MKRKFLVAAVASLFADGALAQVVLPTMSAANPDVSVAGSKMTVDQGTAQRKIYDWTSFNISGAGAWVYFKQPNGTAIAVNRISGAMSTIDGKLTADGHVMLLNQNGVLFGSNAVVNVGSLTASTGRLAGSDADFLNGTGPVSIIGATGGRIEVSSGAAITVGAQGLAAFVAPSVVNSGTITAIGGRIVLAGAQAATVSLNGGLYEMVVDQGVANSSVTNAATGKLTTAASDSGAVPAGTILLSATDAANAVSGVINLNGVQRANRIEVNGGVVELTSNLDATTVVGASRTVNVASGAQIQDAINIAASGADVNVDAGTFAENLSITKALTLKGAGAGNSIIDPASGDAVSISGNMGASSTLVIDGFTFHDAPRYGVTVASNTVLQELRILNSDFTGNGQNGFALLGGTTTGVPGLAKVSLVNDNFVGNGTAPASSLGYGDILINYYNGNATFQNLHITGNGEFIGVQIRGASPTSNHPTAAGVMTFDSVTIDGSFLRPAGSAGTWNPGGPGDGIHLQEYSSVSNVSFNNVAINLDAGYGMFLEGLGSTLHLGNTTFGANTNLSPLGTGAVAAQVKVSRNIFVGSNDNGLVTNVDAAAAVFAGAADGFAIEDRVFHALDAGGLGLVTWDPGNLYVTQASGSIQRGIDAACACATVHVAAGTFAEQLTINRSLTLVGAGADQTVIAPGSLAADNLGMKSIVTVGGGTSTSVDISGFTVKGPVAEANAGIFVRDGAYAHIHGNKVLDIRDGPTISGVQRGIGIFVGRALLGTSGRADIENNIITGYQKGGIVIDGPGSQATVTGNVVTGAGPTSVTAQNGIQISRGASATVSGNTVSGNNYTPASDEAVGILIFTPGANLSQGSITIGSNNVSGNEVGVWTNDPRTLSSISLSGVSGNGRDGEADFGGGYAGQGALLEYPAWSSSSAALVDAAKFGGRTAGDLIDAGGSLRVTGWSGFAAIQPAVDAVTAGGSVSVGGGTYAESVVLNSIRNLSFDGTTLNSLTINAGAAGSGISGSVTASGPGGFLFDAPVALLGPTSLTATGGNIAFNGDIQGAYDLILTASGNITLVSGGGPASPLGGLTVSANDFILSGTLWVSGYDIDARGAVALSGHTLNSIGGAPGTIDAGGDVTGHTTSDGPISVGSGGSVVLEVATSAPVVIQSDGPATVSGSAPSLVIDAPSGSASGSFGQVTNAGGGLIDVNGKPQPNASVAENTANNNRVVPAEITTGADDRSEDARQEKLRRRRQLKDAAEVLQNGEALEIDLSPSN